ncbi:hypothetical protein [Fodinibius sp. AD559]|uniref:hypothetical protein n=1 Tax=Fodinibius sp. AD559 TaxID=3424179 RepID=UPI00404694E7
MRKLLSILFVGLVIVLSGDMWVHAESAAESSLSIVQADTKNKSQSTHPFDQPNLFNAFHQAESGINISNVPAPLLTGEDREQSAVHKFIVSAAENRSAVYLQIYQLSDRVTAVLKYLFPYHAFL